MKKITIYILISLSLFLTSCTQLRFVTINSIEEAQKHAPGIWTHTKVGSPIWKKYVVEDNGSYRMYRTVPIADDWGKPKTGTWRCVTDKYVDTGKRYYAIEFKHSGTGGIAYFYDKAVFIDNKKLLMRQYGWTSGSDAYIYFEKGDKSPFSK